MGVNIVLFAAAIAMALGALNGLLDSNAFDTLDTFDASSEEKGDCGYCCAGIEGGEEGNLWWGCVVAGAGIENS